MENSSNIKTKFKLRELGGAFGDWGTLIPFVIGYISIVGLNPAGIFICLGMTNIILGLKHNLPLPVQPQKTIGSIALADGWSSSLVISTGFGTGIVWAILGLSKKLNKIVSKVPIITVKAIQFGLSLILGWTAIEFISQNFFLGFISIIIILSLYKFEAFPSAIILTLLGIFILIFSGSFQISISLFSFPDFQFFIPDGWNLLFGMLIAGIAQLFLTLTNVMIATVALVKEFFPEKQDFDANILATNMGGINLISPFLGGIPLCHGSGGLASQYAFGARNGGSMIFEGIIELFLGFFLSKAIFMIFSNFPLSIFGAMLLYTSILLAKIGFNSIKTSWIPIILICGIICFFANIAIGFLACLVLYFLLRKRFDLDE